MFIIGQFVVVEPKTKTEGKKKKTFWIGKRSWDKSASTIGQIIKLEQSENLCNLRLNDDTVAVCVSLTMIKPLISELVSIHKEEIKQLHAAIDAKPIMFNVFGWKLTPDYDRIYGPVMVQAHNPKHNWYSEPYLLREGCYLSKEEGNLKYVEVI